MGGIGIWQLIIILVIILLVFGTKKLRNLGSDLGGALKGFKTAMEEQNKNEEENQDNPQLSENDEGNTFDVKAEEVKAEKVKEEETRNS